MPRPVPLPKCFNSTIAVVFVILASAGLGVEAAEYPIIHSEPTPIEPDRRPCDLFETETEFVEFNLFLDLKDETLRLRVPKIFLEDRSDHVQGATHKSQLFRVGINDFRPVSRHESSKRHKAGIWNWTHFLIRDSIPLWQIVESRLRRSGEPRHWNLSHIETTPSEYGLAQVIRPTSPYKDVFMAQQDGQIEAAVFCTPWGQVPFPECSIFFEHDLITINFSFRRTELPQWQTVKRRIDQFVSCALEEDGPS